MAKRVRPKRYTYPMLASALNVSRRTLVRYVVAGSIPQPVTVGNQSFWEGDALRSALKGPSLPGTYEYTPSTREKRRAATAGRNMRLKARKKGNGSIRSRIAAGKADQSEGQT